MSHPASSATARIVPSIPPPGVQIPVLIDSDAKNEVDDQWAISLAMLHPERFRIVGFVGATFGWDHQPPEYLRRVAASAAELNLLQELAGAPGRWPVHCGSPPMPSMDTWVDSAGVDFIIAQARLHIPQNPLWVISLGACTNIVSACLKAPDISERIVSFWHCRSGWPNKCDNFNARGDINAARRLFASNQPLVIFDTGTGLTISMQESEAKAKPHGRLGEYLHEYRKTNPRWSSDGKAMFDLGDTAALLDPGIATWEVVDCPSVGEDLAYDFTATNGKALRCSAIDRDATYKQIFDALAASKGLVAGARAQAAR